MTYNPDQLHNVPVLHYFDYCQAQGLEPKLAIYCGKTLMITSYKANDFLGKVNQFFLKVQTVFFSFFKMLDNDPTKIEKMKSRVIRFHFEQCEKSPEMKEIMEKSEIINRIDEKVGSDFSLLNIYKGLKFDEKTLKITFENEKKEV